MTEAGGDPARGAATASATPPTARLPGNDADIAQPASGTGPAAPPASSLPRLGRILGAVVAPTTFISALLFYFGWSHAYWFFDYFGVNSSLLGLSTRDYVQRSVDGLWVPVTVAACAGLVVLWGHAVFGSRLAATLRPRVLRVLLPVMAIAGMVLVVSGVWSVFAKTLLDDYIALAPLTLAVGVLLVLSTVRLWRSLATKAEPGGRPARPEWIVVAEWVGVFVLVGLSLFWAANDYSVAVGQSRAHQFAAELPSYPSAVVFSAQSLSLDAPGVREMRCRDPEAAYRFRYDGLKLLLQSGDQYVFLPAAWSRTNGVAIVLPRSASLRLEFTPASARSNVQRSAC
jgi:hypothetical protein